MKTNLAWLLLASLAACGGTEDPQPQASKQMTVYYLYPDGGAPVQTENQPPAPSKTCPEGTAPNKCLPNNCQAGCAQSLIPACNSSEFCAGSAQGCSQGTPGERMRCLADAQASCLQEAAATCVQETAQILAAGCCQ
jgi:hypothetical protein